MADGDERRDTTIVTISSFQKKRVAARSRLMTAA